MHYRCPGQRHSQGPQYIVGVRDKEPFRVYNTSYVSKTKTQSRPTIHHLSHEEQLLQSGHTFQKLAGLNHKTRKGNDAFYTNP
ncbi:hypothetical protein RRG08_036882 [Elysia crispata]|uniref:Uncharacterized protein n=1 Tax=Elysia crispata TaxID=231223 RepID=A0AAE1B1Y5_9GAST|nr:hypothetical protein RRG08_036882 [Elysia crispata]